MALSIEVHGVRVTLIKRKDGGLRAYSDDLPGLILSHSDWWKVLGDLPKAIRVIKEARSQPAAGAAG
jgi:hypothetical protein